jgi:hypothetical protein
MVPPPPTSNQVLQDEIETCIREPVQASLPHGLLSAAGMPVDALAEKKYSKYVSM